MLQFSLSLLLVFCSLRFFRVAMSTELEEKTRIAKVPASCPNDLYPGNGQLQSPNWPAYYDNNADCAYFITAAPGFVVQIHFWSFDTEMCCDYVDLFDGPDFVNSAKIGRISGTSINPTTYAASSRWLSMQFHSDATINRPGFNASYYSTSTAYPCNRDVFLSIDGFSTLGTKDNFLTELKFIANMLLSNWSIGHTLTQVVPALMETDEMTSYDFNELGSLADLQNAVLRYGSKPIQGEDPDELEAVFYLVTPRVMNDLAYKSGARPGINRIAIFFLSFMPYDESDLKGSNRYASQIKAEGTKIAIVGMGPNVNVTALLELSSGPKYLFHANSYDDLTAGLANEIQQVICLTT